MGTNSNTEVSPEHQETSFLAVRMTKHWYTWPRELVKSPSLEILKTQLGTVLRYWFWVALLKHGYWTRQLPEVNFQSIILCFCDNKQLYQYLQVHAHL